MVFNRVAIERRERCSSAAQRKTRRTTSASEKGQPGIGASLMASRLSGPILYPYGGRPQAYLPSLTTRLFLAIDRSRMFSRSMALLATRIENIKRPCGVAVSNGSVRELSPTPNVSR